MKKIVLVLMILLLTTAIIGCNNQQDVSNNEFIKKVKTFEENRNKLDLLEITYDQFKDNIDGILTETYRNNYLNTLDNETIIAFKGHTIFAEDLDDISEEKFNEYKEQLKELKEQQNFKSVEYKISLTDENYEGSFEDRKRIYSKIEINVNSDVNGKALYFKAYDFEKEDDSWKICGIKEEFVRVKPGEEVTEEKLKDYGFNKVSNDKIEYVDTLEMKFE